MRSAAEAAQSVVLDYSIYHIALANFNWMYPKVLIYSKFSYWTTEPSSTSLVTHIVKTHIRQLDREEEEGAIAVSKDK